MEVEALEELGVQGDDIKTAAAPKEAVSGDIRGASVAQRHLQLQDWTCATSANTTNSTASDTSTNTTTTVTSKCIYTNTTFTRITTSTTAISVTSTTGGKCY